MSWFERARTHVGEFSVRLGLRITGYRYAKLIGHRSRKDRFVGRVKR